MKKIFLLLGVISLSSCESDESLDGKCWGRFQENDPNTGAVTWEYRVKLDCNLCDRQVTYTCPEIGACGDYHGVTLHDIIGIWKCD